MSISVIFPTRNRPENIRRLYSSLKTTSTIMPEIIIYVDDDDSVSVPVAQELNIKFVQGPRQTLSLCWNEAAKLATNQLFMYAGDDLVFRTEGWDKLVVDEFAKWPDKLILVHGDDRAHGGTHCATHGILHRNWIDAVGYFMPPEFGAWGDNWITIIANDLKRNIYVPFINEHMHFTVGKANYDQTYAEALPRQHRDNELYAELVPKRLADTAKLRALIAQ